MESVRCDLLINDDRLKLAPFPVQLALGSRNALFPAHLLSPVFPFPLLPLLVSVWLFLHGTGVDCFVHGTFHALLLASIRVASRRTWSRVLEQPPNQQQQWDNERFHSAGQHSSSFIRGPTDDSKNRHGSSSPSD